MSILQVCKLVAHSLWTRQSPMLSFKDLAYQTRSSKSAIPASIKPPLSFCLQKIADIEAEMARTQKNKATAGHLGVLKVRTMPPNFILAMTCRDA